MKFCHQLKHSHGNTQPVREEQGLASPPGHQRPHHLIPGGRGRGNRGGDQQQDGCCGLHPVHWPPQQTDQISIAKRKATLPESLHFWIWLVQITGLMGSHTN